MGKEVEYQSVSAKNLSHQIADQITQKILSGELKASDRLPPENELAEQFNVSRTSVREALKILSARKLIQIRQGSGAVVRGNLYDVVMESIKLVIGRMKTTFSELLEARRALEADIASIAAQRATEEDLLVLRRTLDMGKEKCDDLQEYVDLDMQFHIDLASATHNSAFLIMMQPILNLLRTSMLMSYLDHIDENKAVIHHERIFEAIKARKSELASSEMCRHLLIAEHDIQEVIKRENLPQELWRHL